MAASAFSGHCSHWHRQLASLFVRPEKRKKGGHTVTIGLLEYEQEENAKADVSGGGYIKKKLAFFL